MGFNLGFKGLMIKQVLYIAITRRCYAVPHSMTAARYVLFFIDD